MNIAIEIANGRTDRVFDYLAAGGAATAQDGISVSHLQWCAYYGDVSAMRFLLARRASLDIPGPNLDLNGACFHGHWRLCLFLIEQGASVNEPLPETLETPLHAALCTAERLAHNPVMRIGDHQTSVETDGFMRDRRTKGENTLHRAAAFGDAGAIKMLIDAGAVIDAKGHEWRQPAYLGQLVSGASANTPAALLWRFSRSRWPWSNAEQSARDPGI